MSNRSQDDNSENHTEQRIARTLFLLLLFLPLTFCDHKDEKGDLHDAIVEYVRAQS